VAAAAAAHGSAPRAHHVELEAEAMARREDDERRVQALASR